MTKLGLVSAGIMFLAPELANASQPAQPAQSPPVADSSKAAPTPTQGPASAQEPAATAKNAGRVDAKCTRSDSNAKVAPPSAKVGKDTGVLPPPRKKPATADSCTSQPDQ